MGARGGVKLSAKLSKSPRPLTPTRRRCGAGDPSPSRGGGDGATRLPGRPNAQRRLRLVNRARQRNTTPLLPLRR